MENLFSQRFKELLESYDGNYDQLAKQLGFKSKSSISKYANGQVKKIDVSLVTKISLIFGVSPNWLLGVSDDKTH